MERFDGAFAVRLLFLDTGEEVLTVTGTAEKKKLANECEKIHPETDKIYQENQIETEKWTQQS